MLQNPINYNLNQAITTGCGTLTTLRIRINDEISRRPIGRQQTRSILNGH